MKNKKYISLDIEIVLLPVSDVVRTSSSENGSQAPELGGGEDELPVLPFV